MKIAILYICTGKYHIFFNDFYESCERFFLREVEKTYFVFSDHKELSDIDRVHFIYKECEGFPKDSLFRFRTFLTAEKELEKYDYIFFFNANMRFVADVDESILPEEQDGYLCCLNAEYEHVYPHPCFYPYERNKKSAAYIPKELNEYRYYHAGVNGGRAKEYLEMCHILRDNIDKDYKNGIVAIYHDESHLNKYFTQHLCKGLTSEYGAAEGFEREGYTKLIITDKTKYDLYFNKGRKTTISGKMEKAFKRMVHIIRWYI